MPLIWGLRQVKFCKSETLPYDQAARRAIRADEACAEAALTCGSRPRVRLAQARSSKHGHPVSQEKIDRRHIPFRLIGVMFRTLKERTTWQSNSNIA